MISIYYPPYAFGGDAIYVHRLAKELVRQGHEVDVVHCADKRPTSWARKVLLWPAGVTMA